MRLASRLPLLLSLAASAAFAVAPTVTTSAATSVTSTTAQLNGSINPGGESTSGWFRLDTASPGTCNDTFGSRVPGSGGTSVGSGTVSTPYSVSTTGLLPGVTYYYCAIASNASGPGFGAVLSFSTPPLAPTASTTTTTLVTSSTATLSGGANPNGSATTGFFRYSNVNPGACSNAFGTRVPATGGSSLGAGNVVVPYTEAITGLQAGVTYWYCAIATNGVGTGLGNLLSFTALVTAPTVTTSAATGVGGTSATLNGSANPNGSSATGWFRLASSDPGACNDAFGTRVPTSGGTSLGGGTSPVGFSQSPTGLTPGTTYYYCAIASNPEGVTLGTVQTFTTPAAPTVTTGTETLLTATSATLNGTVNANGSAATAWFRYATANPGTCNDTFGTRAPLSGGSSIGAAVGVTAYSQSITGLLPGTTYYVCAIASNGVGTSTGSLGTLTTPPALPVVSTASATLVTATTATLNASGNPRGATTTGWFRYATTSPGTCNDAFGTRAPATGGSNLGSGNTTTSYSEALTGLSPGTTYFFCAVAQNSVGLSFGGLTSFTTPNVPVVTTTAATSVAGTSAVLNGTANPNLSATTAWFRYATTNPGACDDTFGTRFPATGGTSMGSGSGALAFSQVPTTLVPGTTYYYCAIAQNAVGTGFGTVQSFTTPAAPTVTTLAASLVTGTSATLNASVAPNGSTTTVWFRYSGVDPVTCNDTFGTRAPSSSLSDTVVPAGSGATAVARGITALLPGTQYWVCALATNGVGTTFGNVLTFTTPPLAPSVSTNAATLVTGTTATLNGAANPRGDATIGYFRYGTVSPGTCNDTFGTRQPTSGGTSIGSGNTTASFTEALTGLTPGTTYFFCAAATNGVGTTFGSVVSFLTPNVPTVVTGATSLLTGTTVTLNATANPNAGTSTGYFRYATTNPGTCNDAFGTRAPASSGSALGAGSSPVSYSQSLSGLTPGATYFYCALASNLVGVGVGTVQSFTTPAAPAMTTEAATLVAATSVTLNGTVNPNGGATSTYFRYATTSPGTCNDTFGSVTASVGRGSGTSVVTFSQALTGLLPGTTYFFCAIGTNLVGTTLGSLLSFTTPPLAPIVTTNTAASITSTAATLRGSANPQGAATTGWFRYGTSNPGTCNDTFGFRVPFASGTALGSGNSAVAYTEPLTGLSLVTTYYYCAIAQNSVGLSFGAVQSFTTLAEVPTVTTQAATAITTTSATMNAVATPNGSSATGWFRYSTTSPGTCNDTFGTRLPASGGTALGAGTSSVPYSVTPTTLTVGATYYFCAIVQNGIGTSVGAVLTFKTTSTAPTLNTLAATGIGGATAQLNGSVTPNGDATTGWFRYATTSPGTCNDTFGTRAPATGGTSVGAGTTAQGFSEVLTGLTPGATYYFCALASNSLGTVTGLLLTFTTPQSPTVTSNAATPVTANTATLNATAVPNGTAASGWFRYDTTDPGSCNDTFGTRTPSSGGTSLGSGTAPVPYSQALGGLLPGTQYFFCALASNSVGTSFGAVLSFTTPPASPLVAAAPASNLGATTATFNASANPNGAATTGWFRYATTNPGSCNDAFGTRAPTTGGSSLGSGTAAVAYSQAVTGLTPGATYYFCPIASNSVGTAFGGVQSFTLPGAPTVVTSAASLVTSSSAQLNGSATPNRDATTGYFRYDTTNPGTCSDAFGTRAPTSGGADLGSGTTSVPFSQAVTGLSPGTTYFFCAAAVNGVGTTFGPVLSVTTTNAPTPTTLAATSVTASGAVLNGSTNPNGATATAWFRFGTTNPGTCSGTFGTATVAASIGAGTMAVAHSATLTGLLSGTTYFFCAVGSNAAGISYGPVLSFTTAGAPTVTTEAATLVATTSATLNGTARPNGLTTTGWFRYATVSPGTCNDTFGTRFPATGGAALGAGTSFVPYSQALTGLAQGTTYYFCAIASNTSGTRFGTVASFSTQAAPVVVTSAASNVASTSMTINGTGNPQGLAATGWFRYDTVSPGTCNDSFGTRTPATGGTDLGSGTAAVAFSANLTGLTTGTTYYVCALASNANGTGVGTVRTVTTTAAPAVSTSAPTGVLATTATLNGSGDPNGDAATGYFRYGLTDPGTCSDSYGTRFPATGGTALGSGSTAVAFSQVLTGLTQSTTYYYCAAATNGVGTDFGSVRSFTTGAGPLVTTAAASGVTSTTATLNGSANPNGIAATGWFRYSLTDPGACSDTFGTRTPTTGGTALGAGTTAAAYTASLSGLTSGATYYYCAIASNAAGTDVGTVMSFTTLGPPVVTTQAATAVSASGATLNGSGNPAGAAATGWFRYSTTNPVTCNDTFGTRTPATGGTALGSGFTPSPFTAALTGLPPATTYYFCAIASNAYGTRFGTVLSFTTAAGPAVATTPASSVTSTTATLNGSANPRSLAATGWFRYGTTNPGACNDTFGTRAPATGGTDLGSGSTPVGYLEALTGLTPGTTYYYCALASNSAGTSTGTIEVFTTPGPPSITTLAASALGSTGATLNGTGTANLAATTGWFRYATVDPGTCDDTFGTRAPATGGTSLGSGTTATAFTQALTGLTPATTYYFCALASNANGVRVGTVLSFTTTAAPLVTTLAASGLGAGSATLNGSANPRGAAATGWFRYGATNPGTCNDTFGTRAPATGGTTLGSGSTAVAFSEALTGLTPGATYYACAIASNAVGTAVGTVQTFTVTAATPVVTTQAATLLAGTSATLNGTVNAGGAATTAWFRYATTSPGTCTDSFGTRTPATGGTAVGSGTTATAFSQALTGLTPSTTYYFCALASNSQGTATGLVQSFTTPGAPQVTTLAATALTGTSATLNGSANPNGAAATAYFRYATTNPGSCNDTFGTRAPSAGGTPIAAGTTATPFAQGVTGLLPGTTYYACALASNVVGTAFGTVQSFRTPAAPVVMTSSAMVTGTQAVLNGGANPNGAAATGYFRIGTTDPGTCTDTFGTRAPGSGGANLGAGQASTPFSQTVTGLQLGATYYFCAAATNLVGTGFGAVQSFTVAAPTPTVVTSPVVDITSRDATLGASVNPNGTNTTVWFRYATTAPAACDDTFGVRVPETGGLPAGAALTPQNLGLAATGLRPGTEYFVCALASNTGGAAVGNVVSFRTGTEPPTVRTGTALIDDSGAVVLSAFGDTKALPGKGSFALFNVPPLTCNPALGRPVPPLGIDLAAVDGEAPFTFTVTDLEPGSWYMCASVTTAGGQATGATVGFTVPAAAAGCGCGTGAGGLMPLLLGAWVLLRRRRATRR